MSKEKSGNFITNLINSIFGGNDAEAEKKRQLKSIAKRLSKSKYGKFYHYAGNEALPMLAKFMFDFYKVVYPAQTMFQSMTNQNALKQLVIDFYTTEEIRSLEESLSEEKILAMSRQIPVDKLKEQALSRLGDYSDYFTLEKITQIDNLYKQILCFKEFCTFDYYFFLKKFYKTLREADFGAVPNFEKINAEYILDDIKDFMAAAWALPLDADWNDMIKLLRLYKSVEPVTLVNWKKVIARVSALRSSGVFEMMIKLISGDPLCAVEISAPSANIIEPYLDKMKASTEAIINKLVEDDKNSKTNDICSQLFQGVELNQLKNYTSDLNGTFEHKGLQQFKHYQALNYLKVFLIEVFKKDIREFYDVVLVRGHWESQTLSSPFSDAYNALLQTSDKITAFDQDLAEDAAIGIKIKTLLPKTERDSGARSIINRLVADANESAYNYIVESTRDLISMGKIIKSLVEDCQKPKPVLVTNWKELAPYAEVPVKDMCVNVYKKIVLFANLIKTCMVKQEEEE